MSGYSLDHYVDHVIGIAWEAYLAGNHKEATSCLIIARGVLNKNVNTLISKGVPIDHIIGLVDRIKMAYDMINNDKDDV